MNHSKTPKKAKFSKQKLIVRRIKLDDGAAVRDKNGIKLKKTHVSEVGPIQKGEYEGAVKSVRHYILQAFGVQRHAYNWGLAKWREEYSEHKTALSKDTPKKVEELPEATTKETIPSYGPSMYSIKRAYNKEKQENCPWTYHVSKCAGQGGIENVGKAYQNWFDSLNGVRKGPKMGPPKFHKKGVNESFKLLTDHCNSYILDEEVPAWKAPLKQNHKLNKSFHQMAEIKAAIKAELKADFNPEPDIKMVKKKKAYISLPNFGYVRLRETPIELIETKKYKILNMTFTQEIDGFYVSIVFELKAIALSCTETTTEMPASDVAAASSSSQATKPTAYSCGADAGVSKNNTWTLSKPMPLSYLKEKGIQDDWMVLSETSPEEVVAFKMPRPLVDNAKKLRRLDKSIARSLKHKQSCSLSELKILLVLENILKLSMGLPCDYSIVTASGLAKKANLLKEVGTNSSKNLKKHLKERAVLYQKIRRIREDFVHKVSNAIVQYFAIFGVETLNLKGMSNKKGFGLGKSVHGACIGKTIECLIYKSHRTGAIVQKIGRWFPSSKKCSTPGCDYIKGDLKLSCSTRFGSALNVVKNTRGMRMPRAT